MVYFRDRNTLSMEFSPQEDGGEILPGLGGLTFSPTSWDGGLKFSNKGG